MPTEIVSPLQNIIKRLAGTEIQGPAAAVRKRFEDCSDVIAVLCDCSGSMLDLVGSSGLSKFRHLQIALADLEQGFRKIRLVAFGSWAKEVPSAAKLPNPSEGAFGHSTNLPAALELAAKWKPRKTIIVSDGLPDSEERSIEVAEAMTGAIDAIYCGPDAHPAVGFLQKLCRRTGGTQVTWDGRHEISGTIRGLLTAGE